LAEVIKTGYIRDTSIIDDLIKADGLADARTLAVSLIEKSVTVKAAVVSEDFKEGKLREILNFGHTLGHAIERSANYSLRHGEAVSIGLHFAAALSEQALGLSSEVTTQMCTLLNRFGLPTGIDRTIYSWDRLVATMVGDKKSRDGRIRFIGIIKPGEPDWIEAASSELLASTYEKIAL
jgi:3-dehydroquinate synthase